MFYNILVNRDKRKSIETHDLEASQIFTMQLCARQCAQCQRHNASKTAEVPVSREFSDPLGETRLTNIRYIQTNAWCITPHMTQCIM